MSKQTSPGKQTKPSTTAARPSEKKDTTVEVTLHPNWVSLISYCGTAHQNGMICFGTQASIPMNMIKPGTKENVLFGKASPAPLFIKETDVATVRLRVTRKWAGLIEFCEQSFPYGQVCVQVAAGEPKKPIEQYTVATIRFDHPESFPQLVRFYKSEKTKAS